MPIEQVLAANGWLARMRCRGDRLVGPCPVHRGDNPTAFVVDRDRGLWYCFTRCRRGGDIVDLVRLAADLSYAETAVELGRIASMGPWPVPEATQPVRAQPLGFRPFVRRLPLDPSAPFLAAKGITPATAAAFEAGAWQRAGFLEGCVGVRLHDPQGHPIGYAGRRVGAKPGEGKWKFPRGMQKAELLYNHHRVRDRIPIGVALVECPWGVMRLYQLGVPAVALLGTTLHPHQLALLRGAHHIVVLMDGDRAGREGSERVASELPAHIHVVVQPLPEDTDPDDLSEADLATRVSSLPRGPPPRARDPGAA